MVEDSKGILTTILISVSSKTVRHMEKVFTHGTTERFMMENGIKDSSMVTESGEASQETPILESGVIPKLRDSVFTPGKTVIAMKVSGVSA